MEYVGVACMIHENISVIMVGHYCPLRTNNFKENDEF